MIFQIPKLESTDSLDEWTRAVAEQTGTDEVVVQAIAEEVLENADERGDERPETPWKSESSGMTYMWPANEHSDF